MPPKHDPEERSKYLVPKNHPTVNTLHSYSDAQIEGAIANSINLDVDKYAELYVEELRNRGKLDKNGDKDQQIQEAREFLGGKTTRELLANAKINVNLESTEQKTPSGRKGDNTEDFGVTSKHSGRDWYAQASEAHMNYSVTPSENEFSKKVMNLAIDGNNILNENLLSKHFDRNNFSNNENTVPPVATKANGTLVVPGILTDQGINEVNKQSDERAGGVKDHNLEHVYAIKGTVMLADTRHPAIQEEQMVGIAKFDVDIDVIDYRYDPSAKTVIQKTAQMIDDDPTRATYATTFASSTNTKKYNKALSERRADGFSDALVEELTEAKGWSKENANAYMAENFHVKAMGEKAAKIGPNGEEIESDAERFVMVTVGDNPEKSVQAQLANARVNESFLEDKLESLKDVARNEGLENEAKGTVTRAEKKAYYGAKAIVEKGTGSFDEKKGSLEEIASIMKDGVNPAELAQLTGILADAGVKQNNEQYASTTRNEKGGTSQETTIGSP